jgi:hypothetical protein
VQPGTRDERRLVVQQMFPPVANDVLRNKDLDHVSRIFAADTANVID